MDKITKVSDIISTFVHTNTRIMEKKDLNRIKIVLVEKHRTSKWLSEQLGKDPTTVSKWCTNQSQPTLEILLKIAELLEVNYTELVRVELRNE